MIFISSVDLFVVVLVQFELEIKKIRLMVFSCCYNKFSIVVVLYIFTVIYFMQGSLMWYIKPSTYNQNS
jgi:uncharacterized paraquat-inducible protein A